MDIYIIVYVHIHLTMFREIHGELFRIPVFALCCHQSIENDSDDGIDKWLNLLVYVWCNYLTMLWIKTDPSLTNLF